MTQLAPPPRASAASARHRADRAEAIKRAWQADRRPDAAAALRENPDLAADRAVALDLAYEEFCAREEAGEVLDPATFCARFPFGPSLQRLLAVHRFLDDHPDALGPAPATWPAAGGTVGDFLVLRELGRGSFSRVYLAVETTTGDRPVALKVSAAGSREAETLGPLSHPHLIPVLSSRAAGAWTVVAMPFVGTATLEDVRATVWPTARTPPPRAAGVLLGAASRGGRGDDPPFPTGPGFPVHERMAYDDAVAAIAVGLFGALAYLHERGIAHRDIKPSNVLFGPGGHPYLLDFNLASRVTDPWRLVGTLPYMAPEQLALFASAESPPLVDGRPGDVFACGVVLFELLTGRYPFGDQFGRAGARGTGPRRDQMAATLLAAQRAGHPSPGALNPRVRRAVREAVERCLTLDPRARPTAAELVAALSRTGHRRSWRSPLSVLVGTGVVALALSYSVLGKSPPVPEPVSAPTHPFDRGLWQYRQGQHEMAAAEFLAAGEAGRDGRAYGYAAYCLSVGKAPDGALFAADEAIRLGYDTPPVYANRAYAHLRAGQLQKAKDDCDAALERDPNLLAARYTRALAVLKLNLRGRSAITPEALADIDLVTTGIPDNPDVWDTAAQLAVLAPGGGDAARNKAAQAARMAVLSGRSPDALRKNAVLKPLLGHPVYEGALKLPPARVAPSINPHLVCPIRQE